MFCFKIEIKKRRPGAIFTMLYKTFGRVLAYHVKVTFKRRVVILVNTMDIIIVPDNILHSIQVLGTKTTVLLHY